MPTGPAYWSAYGFGELNRSAETRRALLKRPVPRLAIADREGDRMLALILGKAVMLADDTGITGPTITRQMLSERA